MVGIFFRLKWALLRNSLRRTPLGRFGVWFSLAVTVVFGGALGLGLFALVAWQPAAASQFLPTLALAIVAAWAVLPLMSFGTDETLDPRRLATLPIRPPALMAGMLAASSVSFGALATVLVLGGVVVAANVAVDAPAGAGPVVLSASLVLLLMSLAASRMVTTGMSRLLTTRRGRDVSITLSALLGIGSYAAFQLVPEPGSGDFEGFDATRSLAGPSWVSFTPPGQAGLAMGRALEGDPALALLHLAGAIAWTLFIVWVWWRLLRRTLEQSAMPPSEAKPRLGLVPEFLAWVPSGRTLAVFSRELRYLARDVGRRARVAQGAMILLFPLFSLVSGDLRDGRWVLAAGFAGVIAVNDGAVQFGSDGRGLAGHLAAPGSWQPDIVGRNLATLVTVLPIGVVSIVVVSTVTGGWRHAPWAVAVLVVAWGFASALGNTLASLVQFPLPDVSRGNLFAAKPAARPGCLFGLLSMVFLGAAALLTSPVVYGLWIRDGDPVTRVAVTLVSLLVSTAVWWFSTVLLERSTRARQPEILHRVDPR